MIFPPALGHTCLHKLCYLQIVICWQGLCHDTLLTYLLHLQQESRAAAFFCWPQICCSQHIVSFCFTLININTLLDGLYEHSHFPCGVALLVRNKASPPVSVYSSSYYLFPANMIVFFLPAAGSCILNFYCVASQTPAFEIGLGVMKCSHWGEGTNRQWLQMEFGQWSEIPIQKIDRTLFTNWSLKFQRGESHKCYIRSQRSFDF